MAALSNCILSYGSPCVLVSLHYPFTVLLLVQNVHILFFFLSTYSWYYYYSTATFYYFSVLRLSLHLSSPLILAQPWITFFLPCLSSGRTICLQLVSWNELELLFVDNSSASFFPLISHAKIQACHQDWRIFCHLFNSCV